MGEGDRLVPDGEDEVSLCIASYNRRPIRGMQVRPLACVPLILTRMRTIRISFARHGAGMRPWALIDRGSEPWGARLRCWRGLFRAPNSDLGRLYLSAQLDHQIFEAGQGGPYTDCLGIHVAVPPGRAGFLPTVCHFSGASEERRIGGLPAPLAQGHRALRAVPARRPDDRVADLPASTNDGRLQHLLERLQ